jgi:RNA recognition motif-containing protein
MYVGSCPAGAKIPNHFPFCLLTSLSDQTPFPHLFKLKDHFRIAGNVVFASISRNAADGSSKGCGVVQYETVSEARHAIAIMRNHPMSSDAGASSVQLYVREDYQDEPVSTNSMKERKDPYMAYKNQRMGGGSGVLRSERMNKKWSCADEGTDAATLDDSTKEQIMAILRARDAARSRRNYEASDTMREELKNKYNVHIDDRTYLWWIDNNPNKNKRSTNANSSTVVQSSSASSPWRQIPSTPENDLCVNANLVNALLVQRDIARREKDFSTADRLLEQATNAPDGEALTLRIHDESRTWRVWADIPPSRRRFSSRSSEGEQPDKPVTHKMMKESNSVKDECIALVSKFDPSKVQDVRELLQQFPDRQDTILQKLQQRYSDKM